MNHPEWIGRYRIDDIIGAGAAGFVYLAHDPLIDRNVAVKILRGDLGQRSAHELRMRFLREARAAGRLSHPNIVTVYDVGEDGAFEDAFIAMEYLEGITLKDVISGGNRFDARRVAQLAVILANALDYAHSQGVVHRDVKPSNIMLTRDGDLKITDFGIARLGPSDLTVDGAVIGTPNYMSPEQISGKTVDGRSDLFSLGVILFELVTGERPFAGESIPEISLAITTQPAPDPTELSPELPESLSVVIQRCLARDPDDRFQTGRELVRELVGADLSADVSKTEGATGETLALYGSDAGEASASLLSVEAFDFMATRAVQESRRPRPRPAGPMLERLRAAAGWASARWWFWVAAGGMLAVLVIGLISTVGTRPDGPVGTGREVQADAAGGGDRLEGAQADAGPQPSGETGPPRRAAGSAAVPLTSGSETATLSVIHRNHLDLAFIELFMDGIPLWSQGMSDSADAPGASNDGAGEIVEKALFVPKGPHTIEVQITSSKHGIDARSSIDGEFGAGAARRLEVRMDPRTQRLALSWAD